MAIFTGEARPFGLLVDKDGGIWTTPNVLDAGTFADDLITYIPDFKSWKK